MLIFSQFDANFTKQTPVDSPCGASLSESVNLVFQVCIPRWVDGAISNGGIFLVTSGTPPSPPTLLKIWHYWTCIANLCGQHRLFCARVPKVFLGKTPNGFLFLLDDTFNCSLSTQLFFRVLPMSLLQCWTQCPTCRDHQNSGREVWDGQELDLWWGEGRDHCRWLLGRWINLIHPYKNVLPDFHNFWHVWISWKLPLLGREAQLEAY